MLSQSWPWCLDEAERWHKRWSETSKPEKTWKGQEFFSFFIFFHMFPSFSMFLWVLLVDSSSRPVIIAFGHVLSCKAIIISTMSLLLLGSKSVSHCMLRFQKVPMLCNAMPLYLVEKFAVKRFLLSWLHTFPSKRTFFCFLWVIMVKIIL